MKTFLYAFAGAALLFAVVAVGLFQGPGREVPGSGGDSTAGSSEGAGDGGRAPAGSAGGGSAVGPAVMRPSGDGAPADSGTRGDAAAGEGDEPEKTEDGALDIEPGDSELVFELSDSYGQPVAGAGVSIFSGRQRAERVTEADGTAAFQDIHGGVYTYSVKGENLPDLVSAREVTLGRGESKVIGVSLGSFSLSIAGHVKERTGEPLEGIRVFASKELVQPGEETLVRADRGILSAVTDADGFYEIPSLEEADYVVRVAKTEGYPEVRKVYRAGTRTADLVLDRLRRLTLYGTVSTPQGDPVEGARILPTGQVSRQTQSDAQGAFSTWVELNEQQTLYVLTVTREGFRKQRVNVRTSEVGSAESWSIDATLEPMGKTAPVIGTLVDSENEPVAGEVVYLQSGSLNARYQASTAADGRFSLGDVQVGSDYRLLVYPRKPHRDGWLRDYQKHPVIVPEDGLDLTIVLDRIEACVLAGTMVDPSGQPVPLYTLWVRSLKALGNAISVTGDAAGKFRAEGIPEGELLLETRSMPRLSVRGLRLKAGEVREAKVVLDRGPHNLEGQVLSDSSQPLAGARVSLRWSGTQDGIQSSSLRSTVTDAQGRFSFSELGAGDHQIIASSSGFSQVTAHHDVGGGGQPPVLILRPAARRRR